MYEESIERLVDLHFTHVGIAAKREYLGDSEGAEKARQAAENIMKAIEVLKRAE